MKIAIPALAAALIVGTIGTASAAHAPSHRQHPASDYDAYSPIARPDAPAKSYWYLGNGSDDTSRTATGGPVGGIN